ncbi:ribonucleoside-diphosphate reductase subunit beta_gp267 [Bacillus phage vB_BceM_WH1]|nr:ribonucleoside-diphosphate reductase subunit beta_gp267 [Bacillus phage vB_BceM_WH1]
MDAPQYNNDEVETMTIKAVNWLKQEDGYSATFYKQQKEQMWFEDEIPVSEDKNRWFDMTEDEKRAFKLALGGLTLLDTQQGEMGMPLIALHTNGMQKKKVMNLFAMMEDVHSKSYSHIFQTLCKEQEIEDIFDWVETNPNLQYKARRITDYYRALLKPEVTKQELYMAMVASVCLETYLFYSGFFFPLYLKGQGRMTRSGEIIKLICRDEAIHGLFVGTVAQEVYKELTAEEQEACDKEMMELILDLYSNEVEYTGLVYDPIGLTEDVLKYVRYNANRALLVLGKEAWFPEEDVNPIVLNGMKNTTDNYDFFSQKGNGYVKPTNIVRMTDEDFVF